MIIEKIREYVHSQWTLGTLHGAHRGLAPLRPKHDFLCQSSEHYQVSPEVRRFLCLLIAVI